MVVEVGTNATMSSLIVEMIFYDQNFDRQQIICLQLLYSALQSLSSDTNRKRIYIDSVDGMVVGKIAASHLHSRILELWHSRRKTKYLEQMPIKPKLLG